MRAFDAQCFGWLGVLWEVGGGAGHARIDHAGGGDGLPDHVIDHVSSAQGLMWPRGVPQQSRARGIPESLSVLDATTGISAAELQRGAGFSRVHGDPAAGGGSRPVPARARAAVKANPVAELRDARVQRLQQLYGCAAAQEAAASGVACGVVGGAAVDLVTAAPSHGLASWEAAAVPPPHARSHDWRDPYAAARMCSPTQNPSRLAAAGSPPTRGRTPCSPAPHGSRGGTSAIDEDDWEAEVDGLLDWTSALHAPPSPA